jgi:invasion protein IalB
MTMKKLCKIILIGALLAASTAVQAQDQTAPAPQAADPAVDENIALSENFGDWIVRCFKAKSPVPCSALQVAANQDTKQRVMLMSIAYVTARDAYGLQIVVPLGVAFLKGATLNAGDQTLSGMKYTRCERDGCYIEGVVPTDTLTALSAMDKTTLDIFGYNNAETSKLPISLNGFSDALARMKTLARERAVNPPAQPQ